MSPEVSVVMAVHNGAPYLQRTLDSVLAQQGVNFEFIIVNDGSTDETMDILSEYERSDYRLKVFAQENQGLTKSLIEGCALAKGEFIARQDTGDRSLPGRLYRQAKLLRSNTDVAMVTCGYRILGPRGELLGEHLPHSSSREWTNNLMGGVESELYGPHHGSVMFRKSAYEAAGGYRTEFYFAQDLDLWTRMASIGMLEYLPDVFYEIEYNYHSISIRFGKQQRQLRSLIAAATRCRSRGETEAKILQEASKIRGAEVEGASLSAHNVEADYFIGSCLASLRNPAARIYLGRVLRNRPFYAKAWAKLLWSYSSGKLSSY